MNKDMERLKVSQACKWRKLSKNKLTRLARANNWMICTYDQQGNLVRSQSGRDDSHDWLPVMPTQIKGRLRGA